MNSAVQFTMIAFSTYTGNSILSWYVLACYHVSSTCENELFQPLPSTQCVEGSHLCKDCSGRNCLAYWEKNITKSVIPFVMTLTWMDWNQQFLGEWFYMLLRLSYSKQYVFWFTFYSMYRLRVMILEKE